MYLASLVAAGSRRTTRTALDTIASMLSRGRYGAESLDWTQLRYQHTALLRSLLAVRAHRRRPSRARYGSTIRSMADGRA